MSNIRVAPSATSGGRNKFTACGTSLPSSPCDCRRANAKPTSCAKWRAMGASPACMSSGSLPLLLKARTTKDVDFSRKGIRARWAAGYGDTRHVLADAPWEAEVDPVEGFYLHE